MGKVGRNNFGEPRMKMYQRTYSPSPLPPHTLIINESCLMGLKNYTRNQQIRLKFGQDDDTCRGFLRDGGV